jgi:hypothetical protein
MRSYSSTYWGRELAVEDTFDAVFAYVNVVVDGTDATVNEPLNVASTPATTMAAPTVKPCGSEVVNVAMFEVSALFVTVNSLRRISEAPPPPPA